MYVSENQPNNTCRTIKPIYVNRLQLIGGFENTNDDTNEDLSSSSMPEENWKFLRKRKISQSQFQNISQPQDDKPDENLEKKLSDKIQREIFSLLKSPEEEEIEKQSKRYYF